MKTKRALRLAIESIQLQIKGLNVQANLFEFFGLASCEKASKKRADLYLAIEILQELDSLGRMA